MATALQPLPLTPTPRFDEWLASLPEGERAPLAAAASTLGPLFEMAPYLFGLAQANAAWLGKALAQVPISVFHAILDDVAKAGRTAPDEAALAPVLRLAKARTALWAAVTETGRALSTAQTTAALSDLADTALEAAL